MAVTPELAAAALTAQPLWALVPAASRARYVRRAAVAMLDELDELARLLAEQTGWPHDHVVRSELLPAVNGLRALADEGPRALADRRVSPRAALLVGRSSRVVSAPVGLIGLRGPSASPWAEPAVEVAAGLLAGNAVLLDAGAVGTRLRSAFLRAGVPGELVALADAPPDLSALCRRVIDLPRPSRLGTLLVLEGASRESVVSAAMWAAFGGHAAAAGRIIRVAGAAPDLVVALEDAAAALGPDEVVGTPEIVAGLSPEDPLFVSPPTDRATLAVVEVPDADTAVRIAAREGRGGPISVWAPDPDKGERVARRLPSTMTWIGHHGPVTTTVENRIARHVVPRRLEWRAAWAPDLPDDAATQTALAELRHGRESRRWAALRDLVAQSRRRR